MAVCLSEMMKTRLVITSEIVHHHNIIAEQMFRIFLELSRNSAGPVGRFGANLKKIFEWLRIKRPNRILL